jgi:hypothetical protein
MYEEINVAKANSFTPLALMFQDFQGNQPSETDPNPVGSTDDLQNWADRGLIDGHGYSYTYPVLADPASAVAGPWDINNYTPFNFILDKNGVCRYKMIGFSEFNLKQVIEALIAE